MMRRSLSRTVSETVKVTASVSVADFDDDVILSEFERRGFDQIGVDIPALRQAVQCGDAWQALRVVEAGLPNEFAGLPEQIRNADRLRMFGRAA